MNKSIVVKHKDKSRNIVLEPFEVPNTSPILDISLVTHNTRFSTLISSATHLLTTFVVIVANYFIYRSRRILH